MYLHILKYMHICIFIYVLALWQKTMINIMHMLLYHNNLYHNNHNKVIMTTLFLLSTVKFDRICESVNFVCFTGKIL